MVEMTQFYELSMLKDGWLDGDGIALKGKGLDWMENWFNENFPPELKMPYLYPTPNGGVQAEFSIYSYEITIKIDICSHVAVWHLLDTVTNEDEEKTLNMDNCDDSQWIINQLRRYGDNR